MNIGITGHQSIGDETVWNWAEQKVTEILEIYKEVLTGVSSLAIGADQLFARVVLTLGGRLYAVIPFPGYERTFRNSKDLRSYQIYLEASDKIEILEPSENDELSYLAAGRRVVDLVELIIAIWDGKPSKGLGGTGDIVKYALDNNKKVVHFNPIDKEIEEI
ncbi:MAG: hypothetical protein JXM79_15980 [Sedimentisphaerales bacterium]|nr:hypothetical protein [Sedimentisphaerales bacterium]